MKEPHTTDRPRMSAAEFVSALDGLGLSSHQLADCMGYDPRRVRRWQTGGESVPPAVVGVMKLGLALIALKRLWYERHGVDLVVTGARIALHQTFGRDYPEAHIVRDEEP